MTTKVPSRQLTSGAATSGQVAIADGAGGVSFASRLPAACVFNGTGVPAMLSNRGFSASIVDNGVGDYTLTFTTNEPDVNYVVLVSANGTGVQDVVVKTHTATVSTLRISVTQNGAAFDASRISVAILR